MTRAQAIKYAIYVILAVVILSIFPLRVWNEQISTSGKEHPAGYISVGGEQTALQQFTAEYDRIAAIGIYVEGEYYDDSLSVRVFDENMYPLRKVKVSPEKTGYVDAYINLATEVGKTYYYTLEGLTTEFQIPYEMTGNSGTSNNGFMQYAGEVKDAYNLITRYTYRQPMRKTLSLSIIAGLVILGVAFTLLIKIMEKRISKMQELCTLQWALQVIGNPVVILAAVASIIIVGPMHVFSIYVADIITFIAGILLLTAFLLYAINHKRTDRSTDLIKFVTEHWQNIAQAICVALALWACINYMNALYEVFHDITWRKMAFFLGIGIIVTFSFGELVNWYNLVVLIASVILGKVYYTNNLPDMADEYHVETLLWSSRLIPVILILIAYAIRCIVLLCKSKEKTNPLKMISWPYFLVTILLAAFMIVRRNGRYWPVMMTVIVGAFAFRFLFWNKREYLIGNICNGVLIHFFACVVYCLMHRPWESMIYVRFPFVFHTVTITAEYLSLVAAVALVKLFSKYNRTSKLKSCIGELFIFGVVGSYLLFTMSRTGMVAVVTMGLTMWIAFSNGRGLARIRNLLAEAGIVILAILVCMPICFTAQRIVPAVVGEPETMMVEVYPEPILVSKNYDSEFYIGVPRFARAFVNKMFGVNEDKIKLDRYTIYGVQEQGMSQEIIDYGIDTGTDAKAGILLTRKYLIPLVQENIISKKSKDDFIPPRPYPEGSENITEEMWYDEDYWMYDEDTGEWEFNVWKADMDNQKKDVSNGRMDIYRAYYEQLNDTGHESMSAILQDGSEAAHAHDIYLQVAFDHGKMVGIIFIIWVAMTCLQALIVFVRRRKIDFTVGMILAVSVTYAVAGITEWISHPCNPVGLIMMLLVVPMGIYKYGTKD